jgi:hypothetical protein
VEGGGVGVGTGLRAGQFGFRTPLAETDFIFSASVQTDPGAHSSFAGMGTKGQSDQGVTLNTHSF